MLEITSKYREKIESMKTKTQTELKKYQLAEHEEYNKALVFWGFFFFLGFFWGFFFCFFVFVFFFCRKYKSVLTDLKQVSTADN